MDRLIAALAVAAYLSAAFLPCPSVGALEPFMRVAFSKPIPFVVNEPTSTSMHSHHGQHSSDIAASDHTQHGQRGHQDGPPSPKPAAPKHDANRLSPEAELVWMPTCLCGCSESRAWIGGGAARLGPVVPATTVTHRPAVIAILAAALEARFPVVPVVTADPIPT